MKYIIIALLSLTTGLALAETGFDQDRSLEYLVRVHVLHSEVYRLGRQLTVIDAGPDFVDLLVSELELAGLRAAGYRVSVVIYDYGRYCDEIVAKGFYHSYQQVCDSLLAWAARYPAICRLDTIGRSVQNRAILGVRITDNPTTEEMEPEIRVIGAMHGNEKIGTEVPLFFGGWLVRNYASNSLARYLVDNREFWVYPIYNVDGHVANVRGNAIGVDLNRDCGYMNGRGSGSTGPWSQVENQLFKNHLERNNITLEYNFHSAATYVNYLWDFSPADPPDSTLIIQLSRIYADTSQLTAINGYDWYQIYSSLQDADFGIYGMISTTIETPMPTSGSSEIDSICNRNMRALRNVSIRAGWGLRGVVRDSVTNRPLNARIEFVNPLRWSCYTDPDSGDFYKMLYRGTYTVKVCANGYRPKTVSNIVVGDTGYVPVNIPLVSDTSYRYPFKVAWTVYADSFERIIPRSFTALGDSDGLYHSLGKGGDMALDLGSSPFINGPGSDFRVIEGNDGTPEGYRVYASNTWNGPWTLCGSDTGSADFTLPGSLTSARFIRVTDDGDGVANSPAAGFDLDAVKPLRFSVISEELPRVRAGTDRLVLRAVPNPARGRTRFYLESYAGSTDRVVVRVYNSSGQLVRKIRSAGNAAEPGRPIVFDRRDERGRALPAGVYLVEAGAGAARTSVKLVILR